LFFWNDTFGQDSIFFSDFGVDFNYKDDPKPSNASGEANSSIIKEDKIHTISFPSLTRVLEQSWQSIPSKHFPLNKVFVKSRVLHRFRYNIYEFI
jgi:hypothetical protein